MVKTEYIKQAIDEYTQIETALSKLQGISFDKVCKAITHDFYGNTHNYDGTLFDICLSRVLCTIKKGKGKTATLDKGLMFDISDNLSGEWIDTTIDELRGVNRCTF